MIRFQDIDWDDILRSATDEDLEWLEIKIRRMRSSSNPAKRVTIIFQR